MSQDFVDLLRAFSDHKVDHIVSASTRWVLSREHLIRNKRASGRLQDLADVEWLERGDD